MRAAVSALVLTVLVSACATRGHIATPDEVAQLKHLRGLSASGRITLSGPKGRFSARIVFGVSRPDCLRIEIPAAAGLRFLLVAKDGILRADLPQDDAMFEGPATGAVMQTLFGIDLEPMDLVRAILGSPPDTIRVDWRFDKPQESERPKDSAHGPPFAKQKVTEPSQTSAPEPDPIAERSRSLPAQMTIHGPNGTRLSLTMDGPDTQSPAKEAFAFGPPRRQSWTLREMSERLGLRR